MEEEILKFVEEKSLSPFNSRKTTLKAGKNIFKTSDARSVANKFLQHLSSAFVFADTSNIFSFLEFTDSVEEIKRRQEFFKSVREIKNDFLNKIDNHKAKWKIPYSLTAVTESEDTFMELKSHNIPAKLIISDSDIMSLEQYELVYCIDCEEYSRALEQVSGSVFVSNVEDVYLERNLVELSAWENTLKALKSEGTVPERMKNILDEIGNLSIIFEETAMEKIDRKKVEIAVQQINQNIEAQLQNLTISGAQMMLMMQRGSLPSQINSILQEEISKTGLPSVFFTKNLPVQIDEEELENILKKQAAQNSTKFAKKVLKEKEILKNLPGKLKQISNYLIYIDFIGGINKISNKGNILPEICDELNVQDAQNKLITNPQKISFSLAEGKRCSVLTGANSGGKTTLLEHVIQIIVETQLGLPSENKITIPLFTEIYYFAKNKGSTSKGAFETLLTELSTIQPGKKTLILADEVEAVTEPGVAGEIMKATINYFIPRGCFMILATHLGKEIQNNLPEGVRIDGIEATGLDSEFNLIVNHNPVLGRLARSTPELIVEKMAKSNDNDYLKHLYDTLKSRSD